jgi:hypothetical protein
VNYQILLNQINSLILEAAAILQSQDQFGIQISSRSGNLRYRATTTRKFQNEQAHSLHKNLSTLIRHDDGRQQSQGKAAKKLADLIY